ncbi:MULTISPECIES: class I SAM-dependent methyltransferase [Arcobacteraceae]|uniref:class I SAM-dependent methyltransferase n=1 Tax=Arcobacteraceae TaxID=2808963 RepID=UPI000DE8F4CF|nr:class I SAM-dependent methyltransferase [Arcobacter sp. CECT 9188]RBQ26067.1 SAM-dependent methyltransferase [Arcobacter sp. CECT 9188]
MKKRDDGYVLDTSYPMFYYKEMEPIWLSCITNFLGFKAPDITKEFSYLELACGTGINLLVSAISNPNGNFIGIDFNEKHIKIAQNAVKEIGITNLEFIYCDFATFLKNNDRKFDFIVNHGTYSWISPVHQKTILDIVSKFLNNLGIFYLHYMCHPGSTPLLPIQKLLNIVDYHTDEKSNKSIEMGVSLFKELDEAGTFIDYTRIESIKNSLYTDSSYLAHEFLTDFWNPLYSIDVHKTVFDITKTGYLCSSNAFENLDNLSIPSKIQPILQKVKSPILKEYIKDLARNQKQREDIFQKDSIPFVGEEHINSLNKIRFKRMSDCPKSGAVVFKTPIGDINAPKEIISPVLEALAKKDCTFEELLDIEHFKNQPRLLYETILMLMYMEYIHPSSLNFEIINYDITKRFNKWIKKNKIIIKVIWDKY